MKYLQSPLSPYTARLYSLMPTSHFVKPAAAWRLHTPKSVQHNEDAAMAFLEDVRVLTEVGALKKKIKFFDNKPYSVYKRVEGFQFLPPGWQAPNTATKAAADDYERRLRSRYPVVREIDGVWVRVDEVERRVA